MRGLYEEERGVGGTDKGWGTLVENIFEERESNI
jgi:hypothetical protein